VAQFYARLMISAGSIHTASKHGQPAAMIMFRGPSARLIYWTIPVLNLALIAAVRESAFWHKADMPIARTDVCFQG
jgi:hypothetical protein